MPNRLRAAFNPSRLGGYLQTTLQTTLSLQQKQEVHPSQST